MYIGLCIFFGFFLIVGLVVLIMLCVFVQEVKFGVCEVMEDMFVDIVQVLVMLVVDDMVNGYIVDGVFVW